MKLLFICTHNRCRSILAEAVCRQLGEGRIEARSAGSQPSGEVHPLTLKFLAEAGIPATGLQSESLDTVSDWHPDAVITVCDSAAAEACPAWFGECVVAHWGLADPSRVNGSEEQVASAFRETIATLGKRIRQLLDSDFENFSPAQLASALNQLANVYGSV